MVYIMAVSFVFIDVTFITCFNFNPNLSQFLVIFDQGLKVLHARAFGFGD